MAVRERQAANFDAVVRIVSGVQRLNNWIRGYSDWADYWLKLYTSERARLPKLPLPIFRDPRSLSFQGSYELELDRLTLQFKASIEDAENVARVAKFWAGYFIATQEKASNKSLSCGARREGAIAKMIQTTAEDVAEFLAVKIDLVPQLVNSSPTERSVLVATIEREAAILIAKMAGPIRDHYIGLEDFAERPDLPLLRANIIEAEYSQNTCLVIIDAMNASISANGSKPEDAAASEPILLESDTYRNSDEK